MTQPNHTLLWPSDTLAAFEWHPPTEEQRPRYAAIAAAYQGVLSMAHDFDGLACVAFDLQGVPAGAANAARKALLDYRPRIDATTKAFACVVMTQAWNEDARAAIRSISLCRNALNELVTMLCADERSDDLSCAAKELVYQQLLLAKWQANRAVALSS